MWGVNIVNSELAKVRQAILFQWVQACVSFEHSPSNPANDRSNEKQVSAAAEFLALLRVLVTWADRPARIEEHPFCNRAPFCPIHKVRTGSNSKITVVQPEQGAKDRENSRCIHLYAA